MAYLDHTTDQLVIGGDVQPADDLQTSFERVLQKIRDAIYVDELIAIFIAADVLALAGLAFVIPT